MFVCSRVCELKCFWVCVQCVRGLLSAYSLSPFPLFLSHAATQLYDVITDYLFLVSMIDRKQEVAPPPLLSTLIVVSIGSLGAAFMINLLLTAFVLLRERRRPVFAKVPCLVVVWGVVLVTWGVHWSCRCTPITKATLSPPPL